MDIRNFVSGFEIFTKIGKFLADRGEDEIQTAGNALFLAVVTALVTMVLTMVCAFLTPVFMGVNIILWSLIWLLGPFTVFAVWRWKDRRRRLQNEARAAAGGTEGASNPHEEPGNGLLEIGALAGVATFVGLVSTLVIATLCAVASYTHFSPAYVWGGLLAIGGAYLGWTLTDAGVDTLRTIAQAITPDSQETAFLKVRGRLGRSFSLLGIIYTLALLGPVAIYVVGYTDYRGSAVIPTLFLALLAGFATTRIGSEGGGATSTVADIHTEVARVNYRRAARLLLLSALPSLALIAFDNFILPPTCPTPGHIALTCPAELPSYAERWQDSGFSKLRGALGEHAEHGAEEVTKKSQPPCEGKIITFVHALPERDTCTGVLVSDDAEMIAVCREAIACGALDAEGAKPLPRRSSRLDKREEGIPWGWILGGGMIFLALLALLGSIGEGDGDKKKAAGGHH